MTVLQLPSTVTILALPMSPELGKIVVRGGAELVTLDVEADEQRLPLMISFEELEDAFAELPRMFLEPDGSFVWVGEEPAPWQLDGQVYDLDGKVRRIDLSGSVALAEFRKLLGLCRHSVRPVMFELPQEGLFLAEPELIKWVKADE